MGWCKAVFTYDAYTKQLIPNGGRIASWGQEVLIEGKGSGQKWQVREWPNTVLAEGTVSKIDNGGVNVSTVQSLRAGIKYGLGYYRVETGWSWCNFGFGTLSFGRSNSIGNEIDSLMIGNILVKPEKLFLADAQDNIRGVHWDETSAKVTLEGNAVAGLQIGDYVFEYRDNGEAMVYTVKEVFDGLLQTIKPPKSGEYDMTLITCSGEFNRKTRHYSSYRGAYLDQVILDRLQQ